MSSHFEIANETTFTTTERRRVGLVRGRVLSAPYSIAAVRSGARYPMRSAVLKGADRDRAFACIPVQSAGLHELSRARTNRRTVYRACSAPCPVSRWLAFAKGRPQSLGRCRETSELHR